MARIAIVGSGFAGYACARHLERHLRPGEAEIVMITPTDYTLYVPLLPQVAAGALQPRSIVAPLHRKLSRTKLLPGMATAVDLADRSCLVDKISGETVTVPFDVLLLSPGSVTRTFDVPGLMEHAHGLKNLAQAVFLRDHVIAQLELADASNDPAEQMARCSFVVVGGGYSGTETAAVLQLLTSKAMARFPDLDPGLLRWTLVDISERLMPELGEHLGMAARRVLMERGVDVRLGVTLSEITRNSATLTDGRVLPTHTVIWTAGVTPSPVVASLGTDTVKGRLIVGTNLQVPEQPGVFALGDAAAVPDLTRHSGALCAPTAQHAHRQAAVAAHNALATLRGQPLATYRHHDLGMVVDLGGTQAAARPLDIPLTGMLAQLVTRGYHLTTVPSGRSKARVASDWMMHLLTGDDLIRLNFADTTTDTLADVERV